MCTSRAQSVRSGGRRVLCAQSRPAAAGGHQVADAGLAVEERLGDCVSCGLIVHMRHVHAEPAYALMFKHSVYSKFTVFIRNETIVTHNHNAGTLVAGTNTGAIMFWRYVREAAAAGDEQAAASEAAKSGPAASAASDGVDLVDHWKTEPSTLLKSTGGTAMAGEQPRTSAERAGAWRWARSASCSWPS